MTTTLDATALALRVTGDPDPATVARWDALVLAHPTADVTQLSGWARLRREAGYEPLYLLVTDGDRLAGGALVLVRRVPLLGRVGYIPYGPLVAAGEERPDDVLEVLADGLRDLTRRRVRTLFVQPPEGEHRISELLAARGFRPSEADVAPAASLRVDVSADEAELRRALSRGTRRNLKKSGAAGVQVREGTEADLPAIAALMRETGRFHGFAPFSDEYLETMHRELGPAGGLITFVAELDGRPIATTVNTATGSTVRGRFTGLLRSDEVRQLGVASAVYWAGAMWAKQHGYRWYDFNGVLPESVPILTAPEPDIAALPGPDQFKAHFGGRLVQHPQAMERIASPLVRLGYDAARRSTAGRWVVEQVKRAARSGRAKAATD
jgi:lipid II:glycine glycyltransferase (peptidoglycan interpeptide bridge formation enzyme)